MKKITILFSILFIFTLNIKPSKNVFAYSKSSSEIVIEQSTNRVLYEYNSNVKLPMASTTKIITCITAIENSNLSDKVTVTSKTCNIEGSSVYLKEGEIYTLNDLLYGLMLRSGNDCAETIALYVGKTRENFIKLMNDTALKAGATNTNLTNPHGLHEENHYTTAKDLALITSYAMNNDVFMRIISTKSITVTEHLTGNTRVFINKNKLLRMYDGANGVKTGYTKKAGRCLVSSAKRKNMQLISVVLNSPQMFERSSELLSNCFEKYEMRTVLKSNDFNIFSQLKGAENTTFGLNIEKDIVLPCRNDEDVSIKYFVPEKFIIPIESGKNIGKINFYIKNDLIFSQKIYTIESIDNISYVKLLKMLLSNHFLEEL